MVRGDIYFAEFSPRSGSEQRSRRPCILVSHDTFTANAAWQSVTVVPLTGSARWIRPLPTLVTFRAGECGLSKPCSALAHQVTTLDRSKIQGPALGRLSAEKLDELAGALRAYLAL